MLTLFFLTCAVVGGALVAAQLLLSAVAFGAGHGLRLHHKLGGSVAAHRGGLHRGVHQNRATVRSIAMHGVRAAGSGGKHSPKARTAHGSAVGAASGHWAMALVLGMLNFQGIVSGVTVFGLVGLAATAAKQPGSAALKFGISAALVMMALVSGILAVMTGLEKDGTIDLQEAVGKPAAVYLSIPAKNEGQGKVTVCLQQRSMEFPAVTFDDDSLATGQKVVIVAVLGTAIMLVVSAEKYAREPAE